MIKKKAKRKTAAKKSVKKKRPAKGAKELNPAEVRKEVSQMVQAEATEMAAAVIGEGRKGQLAPVKYLFEMANIFPPAPDGEQATEEEDCLAKMLLAKLNAPAKGLEATTNETDEEANEGASSEPLNDAAATGAVCEDGEGGAELSRG
jgi:hypothetical protein